MKSLDHLLLEALDSERRAQNFYLTAHKNAYTRAGKKFFKQLAAFETGHYEQLQEMIEIRTPGKTREISDGELEDFGEGSVGVEEFEPQKGEILTVILKGIEAEKKARSRYLEIVNQINDPQAKRIFAALADEEGYHQRILEDQFYQFAASGKIIWNPNLQ